MTAVLLVALQLWTGPASRACDLHSAHEGAAALLQACLDGAAPGAIVEVPAGTHVFDRQVVIVKPVTLRTAAVHERFPVCRTFPARCATFLAAPAFAASQGLLLLQSTSDVTLQHIVLDGNRNARLQSDAAAACGRGDNRRGFNATALECVRCALFDLVSVRALCGTGFEWTGAAAAIEHSTFRDNGDASSERLWADGLTALFVPFSRLVDNLFLDNSDIGLIVGHGAGALIGRNRIVQRRQPAFAGLMLDNFNSADLTRRGDFRRAVVTANEIECGRSLCGFGIQLGPHPWYRSPNIVGGEVSGNRVTGAAIGINIDGAGRPDSPITVFANTIVTVEQRLQVALCGREFPTSDIDIAPDSYVERRGDTRHQARRRDWHECQ